MCKIKGPLFTYKMYLMFLLEIRHEPFLEINPIFYRVQVLKGCRLRCVVEDEIILICAYALGRP
jgi:hypothetical protein